MDIQGVLKEMRGKADARAEWGIPWEASELRSWADTIEAAMREKDAEIERLKSDLHAAEYEIEDLRDSRDFYKRRCDALQKAQRHMRDPERKAVCDILANGKTAAEAGATLSTEAPHD